ncbi:MBL fold metallo-hydrolase [Bdellovibrio bacteriovorus]|uniref:MBL fold metallo-hydrolase n=1 Tax=Bdellovibrio bacteriovorus TaxID=959 RepID=UPI0021D00B90|nr:MBL fold metallo-hydrolase [Bdellovibrio bacteriovorus]UXR65928.1 MBL fold metallo-hydrolase [Bdellovibrio bacteriovorus]
MKIRQIRNATILLDYGAQKILVDPMLCRAGRIPSLKWLTKNRRRNPLVELPDGTDQVLNTVTHVLITHCQKGHFDHLDQKAIKWIKSRRLPVLCQSDDEKFLKKLGFDVQMLIPDKKNSFAGGEISLVPCLHGEGLVGSFMAHGYGYVLDLPGHPRVYVVGDSILSNEVQSALSHFKPDVVVMPGGGARFDIGGEIIMGLDDVLPMLKLFSGTLVVNHLEALDHCPVTRQQVREVGEKHGMLSRLLVPADGEQMEF